MKINHYIQVIQVHLLQTHSRVFEWFEEPQDVKSYRPADQGWTIAEILEHIALTSHFLLKLIDKGTNKALRKSQEHSLEDQIQHFDDDLSRLDQIGIHKSFEWIRPEHMEPTGIKSEWEVKDQLIRQVQACLDRLSHLKNGEGLFHQITMSVHDLGKMNVYEYIYFLSKHAERHIDQMEENKAEYRQSMAFS